MHIILPIYLPERPVRSAAGILDLPEDAIKEKL
jgi:hypothetical protein